MWAGSSTCSRCAALPGPGGRPILAQISGNWEWSVESAGSMSRSARPTRRIRLASVITAVEVEDYDTWRTKFDSMEGHRREHRLQLGRVYQDVANPNKVTVVMEGDLSDLRAYTESQALKEAMAEGGVVGPPQFSFANDVT